MLERGEETANAKPDVVKLYSTWVELISVINAEATTQLAERLVNGGNIFFGIFLTLVCVIRLSGAMCSC